MESEDNWWLDWDLCKTLMGSRDGVKRLLRKGRVVQGNSRGLHAINTENAMRTFELDGNLSEF